MPTAETAADLRGPYGGDLAKDLTSQIAVVLLSAATQVIDLSTATYFNGTHYTDKFLRLISDVQVYYYWSNNASAALDETVTGVTSRAQQCDSLPANFPREECPAGQYIVVKGSVGKLRISITNQVSR